MAPLVDGRVMTGAVKWDRSPVGARLHRDHMDTLARAADAGRAWAHAALRPESPLYYVAAGGFTDAFREEVEASGHSAICWTPEELYAAE